MNLQKTKLIHYLCNDNLDVRDILVVKSAKVSLTLFVCYNEYGGYMRILVTRHGQTDWNVLKKVQGKADINLNEFGKEQALITKNALNNEKIDLIICSPLKRARETAEIINKDRNIKILFDDRISERDFGEFEGIETSNFDFRGYWDYYKNYKYDKAENIQEFFKRVYNFLDSIIEEYKDKTILLVTHGGVSIPINCYFNKNIPEGSLVDAGLVLGNCQVKIYSKE